MKLIYLATPYTRYPRGLDAAFEDAAAIAGALIKRGLAVFSPICHSHPIAKHGGIDAVDHELWMRIDREMWDRCDELLVAKMDGWDQSRGVAAEIEYFLKRGAPVTYTEVGDILSPRVPPPHYDLDSVAFRHGDVDKVCGLSRDPREILEEIAANANKAQQGALAGEFTQPPNCVHESTKSKNLGNVEKVDSAHPMAAEGLRLADEQPCNPPRRSESAWGVTWPCTSAHDASEVARRDLNERYKRAGKAFEMLYPKPDAPQTEYQTLVGN